MAAVAQAVDPTLFRQTVVILPVSHQHCSLLVFMSVGKLSRSRRRCH